VLQPILVVSLRIYLHSNGAPLPPAAASKYRPRTVTGSAAVRPKGRPGPSPPLPPREGCDPSTASRLEGCSTCCAISRNRAGSFRSREIPRSRPDDPTSAFVNSYARARADLIIFIIRRACEFSISLSLSLSFVFTRAAFVGISVIK